MVKNGFLEKIPPQNIEAEKCLLGCLMIDPEAILKVADFLTARDFYKEVHQKIYTALIELFSKRETVDILSVSNRLKEKKQFDDIGGASYLTNLVNSIPTASHLSEYARIVQQKRILRDLIGASQEISEMGYNEEEDVDVLLDKAEKRIFGIAQKSLTQVFTPVKETLEETFKRIDELSKHKGSLRGIPTGFRALDNILAGLQKSDLIILAARPSLGKCVSKDTEIINPNPGSICTIEEMVKTRKKSILSLNENLKISQEEISDFIDNGIKPVFQVKTALGREVETTLTHPFLTIDGWKPLLKIKVGERIAVPRVIPIFGKTVRPDWEIKSLAYFITEGGLTNGTPRFTSGNKTIIKDFIQSIRMFPNIKLTINKKDSIKDNITYSVANSKKRSLEKIKKISRRLKKLVKEIGITQKKLAKKIGLCFNTISTTLNGHCLPLRENFIKILSHLNLEATVKNELIKEYERIINHNSVTEWLKSLGLMDKVSRRKFIPSFVFTLTKNKLALFLNRLFACDGSFWKDKKGRYHISYSSSSKKLIRQVQHLLLRFGIVSRLRRKRIKYNESFKITYELEVHNAKNLLRFIKKIGIYGKDKKLLLAKKKLFETKLGWTQDTIPIEIWNKILEIKGKRSWRSIYQEIGLPESYNIHASRRSPRRETIAKLAQVLHSQELKDFAQSDIYWDKVVSIKYKGKKQVYDLTIPDTHNFIANDFVIHNSAMAADIARNVACQFKIPVGIFSLEMSKDQIVDRLIAAQANIDLWRLRTGRLSDSGEDNDFERIQKAMGVLSEAPIYIDDIASSNILQMRAMARRLQTDKGLGLLIVDYLQLMEHRNPNLSIVQQVTENSKALKSLAKELAVPVLAISQLSRAVEQRSPQIPRLADLRESGCLTGDALITRADTGERIPIKELVGKTDIPVHSLDENWQIKEKKISKVFPSGEKMVYELKLRSGKKIKASANHPFWKISGWTRLDELKVGDRIATPKKLELSNPKNKFSFDEIILLAHLLGDGCILPRQPYYYTSADKGNIKIVKQTAKKLFNINGRIVKQENWWHVYLPSPYHLTHNKYHPITNWYQDLGIKPCRSFEKEIPQKIFSSNKEKLSLFLKHLWATDGNISHKYLKGRKPSGNIYYATTSEKMAEGIRHLLLRFGIRSRISGVKKANYRICYHVSIQGKEHQLKFVQKIGSFGERGKIIPQLIENIKKIDSNTNLDIWPKEIWKFWINPIREEQGMGWREFSAGIETSYCGTTLFKHGIGTERMKRIANLLRSPLISDIVNSDIFWDEIISIKPLGIEKVYDATVPGTHNFVANDIVVENSLEQDADVVLFIYKEDRYKPNTEKKNVADIIIAKHRNGPVGKIELYFDEPRVSFRDLEKGYEE